MQEILMDVRDLFQYHRLDDRGGDGGWGFNSIPLADSVFHGDLAVGDSGGKSYYATNGVESGFDVVDVVSRHLRTREAG